MIRFFVASFFIIFFASNTYAQECEKRCERLNKRTLERVGFDDERLKSLFERQRPLGTMKDICWRLYDNLDCMKRCDKSREHQKFAKLVKNKCQFVLRDMESNLQCVSRHHSFLNVRCRSFSNEASTLRRSSDLSLSPPEESCRFLHLNTLCLENAVAAFCPTAKKIFRRLYFRDYYLNFLLPDDDSLFDEHDLDSCQMYNFVKDNEKEEGAEKEIVRKDEEYEEEYEEELTTLVNQLETSTAVATTEATTTQQSTTTVQTTAVEVKADDEKKAFTSLLEELLTEEAPTIPAAEVAEPTEQIETTQLEPDDYNEYNDEGDEPQISVVPIESRETSTAEVTSTGAQVTSTGAEVTSTGAEVTSTGAEVTSTGPDEQLTTMSDTSEVSVQSTTPRRVFSDDSLENTPPNFFYSSLRGHEYSTSTRPNHKFVSDDMNPQDSHEDPTLEIDTSTLFGIETTTATDVRTEEFMFRLTEPASKPTAPTSTSQTSTSETSDSTTPLLGGHIIVKQIKKWDEPDSEDAEQEKQRQRQNRRKLNDVWNADVGSDESTTSHSDDTTTHRLGLTTLEWNVLVLIVATLTAVALLTAAILLCCLCVRRRSASQQKMLDSNS